MHASFRRALSAALVLSLGLSGGGPLVAAPSRDKDKDRDRIVHALNRLGYGARPGDVEAVARLGLDAWIDRQLHPETIADSGVTTRLASLRTVGLPSSELLSRYDIPPGAKREIQKRRAELGENASEEEMRQARQELIRKYAGGMEGPPRQVLEELQAAKLLRAVYSERQLDEVLVDFWLNHFNVFAGKGPEKFLLAEYEREAIRKHAWGKFEDLLRATAESPAMLFYLDNWLSVDPGAIARLQQQREARMQGRAFGFGRRRPGAPAGAGLAALPGQGRLRGLNENYAREIMELHTLGVDGGYTQKDVTEVARCFTGWTIKGLRQEHPEFTFEARLHDPGDKTVLGHTLKGGGKDEAEKVIHLLATHPSTARFVSYKLARHFVADEPPKVLVDRAAETFRKTDGDIRSVVKTIVTSREFFADESRGAKVKTPLEFVASAVRASGASVEDARDLLRRLASMGMPLYEQQPPTGYKDTAEAWVSTSGLLSRLNLALDLAAGRVRGVSFDTGALTSEHYGPALADALAARLLPGGLTASTRETLDREIESSTPARVAGLILGSPEFQRR
jgi:uncharacterized protein (DUF1800 family)